MWINSCPRSSQNWDNGVMNIVAMVALVETTSVYNRMASHSTKADLAPAAVKTGSNAEPLLGHMITLDPFQNKFEKSPIHLTEIDMGLGLTFLPTMPQLALLSKSSRTVWSISIGSCIASQQIMGPTS